MGGGGGVIRTIWTRRKGCETGKWEGDAYYRASGPQITYVYYGKRDNKERTYIPKQDPNSRKEYQVKQPIGGDGRKMRYMRRPNGEKMQKQRIVTKHHMGEWIMWRAACNHYRAIGD